MRIVSFKDLCGCPAGTIFSVYYNDLTPAVKPSVSGIWRKTPSGDEAKISFYAVNLEPWNGLKDENSILKAYLKGDTYRASISSPPTEFKFTEWCPRLFAQWEAEDIKIFLNAFQLDE
jgi:hypothetical protein